MPPATPAFASTATPDWVPFVSKSAKSMRSIQAADAFVWQDMPVTTDNHAGLAQLAPKPTRIRLPACAMMSTPSLIPVPADAILASPTPHLLLMIESASATLDGDKVEAHAFLTVLATPPPMLLATVSATRATASTATRTAGKTQNAHPTLSGINCCWPVSVN